jgi:O-antigen/teichoic acid export membrane protein
MKSKNILKNLSAIGLSDIIGTGATAFFWFYLASVISPEKYGEIFFYLGIATIISSIILIANQNTITVYLAKKIKLQSTLYVITLIATVIASLVIIFWFYRIDVIFVLIGFVFNTLAIGELLGRKLFNSYSKYLLAQKGLVVLLGLSFFYIFGIDGILYAIGLSYIFYTILVYRGLKSENFNFPLLKEHAGFVTNNYSFGIIQVTRSQIDKIIIPMFLSFSILGNYALGLQIMAILNMFPNIVYKFILPYDANQEPNTKIKIITILSSIGFAFGSIVLSPYLIPILFPAFNESIIAIQIMSLTAIPSSITLILTSKFLGLEKSRYVLIGRILSLSVITSGMIFLGMNFGIIGLAISYLLANSIDASFLSISNYYLRRKK